MSTESPCLTCGACCANFRVSFYWGECQSAGGTIPDELTLQVSPHHACMKGTEKKPVKCVALIGTPGEHVCCSIYEQRSSTCREFDIVNADGSINEDCTRARAVYGLPPVMLPQFIPTPESVWATEVISIDEPIVIAESIPLTESAPTAAAPLVELLAMPDNPAISFDDPQLN